MRWGVAVRAKAADEDGEQDRIDPEGLSNIIDPGRQAMMDEAKQMRAGRGQLESGDIHRPEAAGEEGDGGEGGQGENVDEKYAIFDIIPKGDGEPLCVARGHRADDQDDHNQPLFPLSFEESEKSDQQDDEPVCFSR